MTDSSPEFDRQGPHGVWCPALTPLDERGKPDPQRFAAHARWLFEQGCHGVVVFGTTGEAPSFTIAERMDLLEQAVDAGLPPERLIVGNGCCALADSADLTIHAFGLGCFRFLTLPPFYFKNLSEDGLFRSYAGLIEQVGSPDLRILLYHFPQLSGVPIPFGVIDRLVAAYPEVVIGIKDSTGDAHYTTSLAVRFPDLAVFAGTDALLLPVLRVGGAGCIAATANVNPAGIRRVWDAFRAADPEIETLQERADAVRAVLDRYPLIPGLKQVLAAADPAWQRMRPPLVPLSGEEGRQLLEDFEAAGGG